MHRIGFAGALVTLALGLALPGSAIAQPPFGHRPGGPPPGAPGRLFERHAERLGLDEGTLNRIQAIVDESRDEGEELHTELFDAHAEMRRLLGQDAPDEAAVMQQAERIGKLETEARKHRLATMLRIHQLLTPEQRAELREIHEERGPRHRRWEGGRWGDPEDYPGTGPGAGSDGR